jgi:hypothetical protein
MRKQMELFRDAHERGDTLVNPTTGKPMKQREKFSSAASGWKTLSNIKRLPFVEEAALLRAEWKATKEELKPPAQPYTMFIKQRWPIVQAEYPGMPFQEIVKHIGREWRHLPEDEKARLHEEWELAKKRYHERMRDKGLID